MKWQIPAKTFLVGEYAALEGGSAIILTTTPLFNVELTREGAGQGIHPHSPAGKLWADDSQSSDELLWSDPYQGLGGVGASSAQFIGAYLAQCYLSKKEPDTRSLLKAYYYYAWDGEGVRPSGYDILAQTQSECVYINRQRKEIAGFDWLFKDLSFLLLRSGKKLATHEHLQTLDLGRDCLELSFVADQARVAFETVDSRLLIDSINTYQHQLSRLNLTADHSLEKMEQLKANKNLLAIKGCGAMGADILLLIFPREGIEAQTKVLLEEGWTILASEHNLYREKPLLSLRK